MANNVFYFTVFTGFLGAGKTSIILSLLSKVPSDYKIVVLKNEFGDVEVDSALVRDSNVAIQEMLNGCLCCVLVGQMKNALLELQEKYNPDRVIVETSGSAFPAPIAWQIREMASNGFVLDAILTVIDCVNFMGYEDTSYTAKMQAKYTDLIILNKHELVDERHLDKVIDHVNDLNTDTPKLKVDLTQGLSPQMAFGLDTPLFSRQQPTDFEAIEQLRHHHAREIDIVQLTLAASVASSLTRSTLETFLASLPTDQVYRVKGFVRFVDHDTNDLWIVNSAFGRCTLTKAAQEHPQAVDYSIRITVMGQDLRYLTTKITEGFGLPNDSDHVQSYWRP
ncbi:CobW/HypB/UreG, nucleotide-binding domain-containing protein [Syncephalis fuscata]|nr:CobW/HypB/UreG, nucleotide-binding domain-containing protein [Syncephalis fuscata]